MEPLLIVGCGAVGRRVAALALARGMDVCTFNRGEAPLSGVRHQTGNLDEPDTLRGLPTRGAGVIYLAPPPGGGIEDTRMHNFLSGIAAGDEPAKVVYISTSGVYGGGSEVVTEETEPVPQTARGKRRLHAERLLQAWGRERGVAVVVLRVTAIYAADRLPVTQLTTGQPVLREQEALPSNRIHADDLSRICLAALERGKDGAVFNVSDGAPSTMTAYFNAAADRLGLPRPRQVTLAEARQVMTPLMISYFSEGRIVDSSKMLKELGVTLLYPNLEAGLKG
ncbi:NAD-dependent epimerase/dehydratase family protein [Geomonas nitrogeniifigens]|uniref:NAD-dependent epimerase/dehydratase family protein n=1 Tax=Geomonas diazotrophica TaxID=2843197 RepID=A0ABX8JNF5_9BACT|nr:NAD-dependent epimerase/dehydratase family protein [Geomonas nitrogeniifigens]QWV99209.1 NAD-dependent epimerase/dehydratase family protein [Geomonas nitrogeniifigens]QXE88378.1 NAD-dependent epimerase/dehydratase family protein [Geomonas nitrogeniifigens]